MAGGLVLGPLLISVALAGGLPETAELRYELRRVADGTGGAYLGWGEQLESLGTYTVEARADAVHVHGRYAWDYAATDGARDSGREDRVVKVGPATRLYVGRTDLDEYDDVRGDLATWLWVPPDVRAGDRVTILDHSYVVRSRGDRGAARGTEAILVVGAGTGARDDAYGQFRYRWEDRFWFDPATGLVVAERYEEWDEGKLHGEPATFHKIEWLDVTSASYLPTVVPAPHPPGFRPFDAVAPERARAADDADDGGVLGLVIAVVGGALVLLFVLVRTPENFVGGGDPAVPTGDNYRSPQFGQVAVREIGATVGLGQLVERQKATTVFAPWIEDLVTRTRVGGGKVAVALDDQGVLVGLGLRDGFGDVGTILSPCPVTTELLRRLLGLASFFSEQGHRLDGTPTYNVHERFVVLRGPPLAVRTWDRDLVRPMAPEDLEPMVALASTAFGEPCRRWLEAAVAAGDVALVARRDGRVVGFGLAAVADDHGRLHGLVVDPAERNQGIGSELVAARLAALADLGVVDVVVEVAIDNAAMLNLLDKHGFEPVGTLVVETTDQAPVPRTWRRS